MSLDGFITGPSAGVEHPLGEGGDRLHAWVYDLATFREKHGQSGGESNTDSDVLDEAFKSVGATIMGKRMFDVGVEPGPLSLPFTCRCTYLRTRLKNLCPEKEESPSTSSATSKPP